MPEYAALPHTKLPHCEIADIKAGSELPQCLLNRTEPLVLRGFVSHWRAVSLAQQSTEQLHQYLLQFYTGEPMGFFFAQPQIRGRFFYNEDLSGFNFEKVAAQLDLILSKLRDTANLPSPPAIFVGGTHLQRYLPGFELDNPPVPVPHEKPRNGLWIGNQSRVAIHQDLPMNIACCVAGRRRFTLFPPAQTPNLYVGPLEHTPSGQPVSLVDMHNIDLAKYPRFAQALQQAMIAELQPGDALFIPSMWWHEAEALAPFNMLINYWWRSTPDYVDAPVNALHHALLSIAQLPSDEKKIWQDVFNYYVFSNDPDRHTHIPAAARGMLDTLNDDAARRLRTLLLQALNR